MKTIAGILKPLVSKSEFIIEKREKQFTISAGSSTGVYIDIAKIGYTPISIIGLYGDGNGNSYISFYRWGLTGSTQAYVGMRSTATSAKTMNIVVQVLYRGTS